jgi:glycoside/pentoside/hexuronide:cation symporter, GPH family
MHGLVKAAAGDDKPVIIAETGWPRHGRPEAALPCAGNAMKDFIDAQHWARSDGGKVFCFSSFDEPWKLAQEGEVGTAWGLWDKDEQVKYGV